jgi:hypothetical protein
MGWGDSVGSWLHYAKATDNRQVARDSIGASFKLASVVEKIRKIFKTLWFRFNYS